MKKKNNLIPVGMADDHTLLRKGLIDLINATDKFNVVAEAENGRQLIEALTISETLPVICILDINMPDMDGYATLEVLRIRWPEIRVLALSMYHNEHTIIRMLRAGARGYLLKNCDPGELIVALTAIAEEGYYQPGKLAQLPLDAQNTLITPKELEFLKRCCTEKAYTEIADKMNVSPRTVEDYRDNLFRKLKINTRTGLVLYALNSGIVLPPA